MAVNRTSKQTSNNEPVKTIGELIRQAKKREEMVKRRHTDHDEIEQIFANKPYERAQQALERRREEESPRNKLSARLVRFVLDCLSGPHF